MVRVGSLAAPHLVAVVVLGWLAACSGPAPSATPLAIEGIWWQAVSVNGSVPRAGAEPRLRLDNGRVEGTTGCNSFGGAARVVDGRLLAPALTMTLIGCDDAIGAVERDFIRVLADATLSTNGTRLVLAGGGGEVVLIPGDGPPQR